MSNHAIAASRLNGVALKTWAQCRRRARSFASGSAAMSPLSSWMAGTTVEAPGFSRQSLAMAFPRRGCGILVRAWLVGPLLLGCIFCLFGPELLDEKTLADV